jgi:hypothetical protein
MPSPLKVGANTWVLRGIGNFEKASSGALDSEQSIYSFRRHKVGSDR